MATHSSILAWKIPWTEEPLRLQSMGSQSQTRLHFYFHNIIGLPHCLSGKETACNAAVMGNAASVSGLGRSPSGEHDNPLQYSCLENPMDRGAWQAIVHRVTKSWT